MVFKPTTSLYLFLSLTLSLSQLRLTLAELPVSDCEKAVLVAKVGCLVVMVSPFLAGSRSALAKTEKIYIYFFSSRLSFALQVAAAVLLNQPLQRSSDSSPHVMVGGKRLSVWRRGGTVQVCRHARWGCVRVLRHTVMDQTGLPCSVLCAVLCVPI